MFAEPVILKVLSSRGSESSWIISRLDMHSEYLMAYGWDNHGAFRRFDLQNIDKISLLRQ